MENLLQQPFFFLVRNTNCFICSIYELWQWSLVLLSVQQNPENTVKELFLLDSQVIRGFFFIIFFMKKVIRVITNLSTTSNFFFSPKTLSWGVVQWGFSGMVPWLTLIVYISMWLTFWTSQNIYSSFIFLKFIWLFYFWRLVIHELRFQNLYKHNLCPWEEKTTISDCILVLSKKKNFDYTRVKKIINV